MVLCRGMAGAVQNASDIGPTLSEFTLKQWEDMLANNPQAWLDAKGSLLHILFNFTKWASEVTVVSCACDHGVLHNSCAAWEWFWLRSPGINLLCDQRF